MESHIEEIKKVFPNAGITQKEGYFKIKVPGRLINIVYTKDLDLQKFTKNLQKMNKQKKEKTCGICLEIYKYSFFCNICFYNVCVSCFNKIRFENYGKIVCPYCRDTRGHKSWNRFNIKINSCLHDMELLKHYYENISIMLPAAIYIKYFRDDKRYKFDSGGIFEEIDGKQSNKCKRKKINWYSFYYDVLADLFDHPIFEMVT